MLEGTKKFDDVNRNNIHRGNVNRRITVNKWHSQFFPLLSLYIYIKLQ